MRFEYNADLTYDERVKLVAEEIREIYPLISYDEAVIAASHAIPIDDKATNDAKFDRYYFILRTISRNNAEFINVFKDAYSIYKEGLKKDSYNNAMEGIIKYANSDVNAFPELVED